MKHARHCAGIKLTLASVNGDVVGSRFPSSLTSLTPSSCTWTPSFRSLLRKSTQFCKSTTVMTVVLTHYMTLNTIRTISCSVKTDNSCRVQIYCIATYRIANTKKTPKQRTLLLQNIMVMSIPCSEFLSWATQTQSTISHDLLNTNLQTILLIYA
jgi:hypothetical protein